jgi:hypothetical protein
MRHPWRAGYDGVGQGASADVVQDDDDAVDLLFAEDHVRALGRVVGEGRLVESAHLNDAVGRGVLDDQLDEVELTAREASVGEVPVERCCRCLPGRSRPRI